MYMIGDEFSEGAKAAKEGAIAVQEVAKTAQKGIEATEKLAGFVSRIIGEPADAVRGILTDRLNYVRWERQQRLTARAKEFIDAQKIEDELRILPPKIAIPIIENASLEENDELQDLWARLIASAVNPNFEGEIRTAFVDIIKQLEVNDAHVLKVMYGRYLNWIRGEEAKDTPESGQYWPGFSVYRPVTQELNVELPEFPTSKKFIIEDLKITETTYRESVDNLIRVRCITPFVDVKNVEIPRKVQGGPSLMPRSGASLFPGRTQLSTDLQQVTVTHGYDAVCITSLGIAFANACIKDIGA
jgi:hypothetical protein